MRHSLARALSSPVLVLVPLAAAQEQNLLAAQEPTLLAVQSPTFGTPPPSLVRIDPDDGSAIELGLLGFPSDALAWSPDGELFAASNLSQELVVLDPVTGQTLRTIGSTGTILEGMACHPLTGELYGLAWPGTKFVHIDPATAVVTEIGTPFSNHGAGLAFTPDGTRLFAADWASGHLWDVDPATGDATIAWTINGSHTGGPLGIACHPITGDLYVAEWYDTADSRLLKVELPSFAVTDIGPITGFSQIEGLTFTYDGLGVNYCGPAVPNSTGASARVGATGSRSAATNDVTLQASSLPVGAAAFFLASRNQTFMMNPGGSQGHLCLDNLIGRIIGPGQIVQADANGDVSVSIDLTAMPQPTGTVSVLPGDTWNFQCWYRDAVDGQSTSNFTDGLSIRFR